MIVFCFITALAFWAFIIIYYKQYGDKWTIDDMYTRLDHNAQRIYNLETAPTYYRKHKKRLDDILEKAKSSKWEFRTINTKYNIQRPATTIDGVSIQIKDFSVVIDGIDTEIHYRPYVDQIQEVAYKSLGVI